MPESDSRLGTIPSNPVPQDYPRESYNVSGLVVMCRPLNVDAVSAALNAMTGVEVHASNEQGKLVVTVEEMAGEQTMIDRITLIQNQSGVISASLVYNQIDAQQDLDNNVETTP
ncbi:chaperone NapD [Aestuariirhabdus sp. Z084]|uniref:chaperone NapD n=1 Tax=Aestuariirhabdus haliotis TaxID=2918751 RepID=UPI00201B4509|nr:chaperone NapD [Aestuariirhabdus haliotis]MCL6416072.1 chaperone NapD [Aestuariirhabdus haliotis]MCL6419360.1 chaperone NapD [Aestuariirhabdus haliotis]